MADIDVKRARGEDTVARFVVTVTDGGRSTSHDVAVGLDDFERLGRNFRSLDEFVRACFEFLLAREPKESILPSFDVSTISRYFPEFEQEIGRASPF